MGGPSLVEDGHQYPDQQPASAQPHQLLACGCNVHASIPVLLVLRSQSFDGFAAWVLDSTCRPCRLSDRMLAIIYVLAGSRAVFLAQYLVTIIPGLLHVLLLDSLFGDSWTQPLLQGCCRLETLSCVWLCSSRRLLAPSTTMPSLMLLPWSITPLWALTVCILLTVVSGYANSDVIGPWWYIWQAVDYP